MIDSMPNFNGVSVIIPVINETSSLVEVVKVLFETGGHDLNEIIIVVCEKTSPDSLKVCEQLKKNSSRPFIIHKQRIPFLGGAIRDAFLLAKSSHSLVVFSDGEADPSLAGQMIEAAKQRPDAVISASRWLKGGRFEGYKPMKLMYNYFAQRFFAYLYQTKVTDMTFGYRMYPTTLVNSFIWEEKKHAFVFESILKLIRAGVECVEIPTVWRARCEGESQLGNLSYLRYFWIGLKYKFFPVKCWIRPGMVNPLTQEVVQNELMPL